MRNLLLAATLCLVLLSDASANADAGSQKLDEIREQQSQLQAEVRSARGAFKEMASPDRTALLAKQDRVLTLIEGKKDVSELTEADRMELFNALDEIKGAVAKAEDERKVCKRVKTVGSNMPQLVCMTVAQQREQRERAREEMTKGHICADSSCRSN